MTWQKLVSINEDEGTMTFENADGDQYDMNILRLWDERLGDSDEIHIDINHNTLPILQNVHQGSWDDDG